MRCANIVLIRRILYGYYTSKQCVVRVLYEYAGYCMSIVEVSNALCKYSTNTKDTVCYCTSKQCVVRVVYQYAGYCMLLYQ